MKLNYKNLIVKNGLMNSIMKKRIAYFVGDFPSRSETWIFTEIMQLMQQDINIKIFSVRDKKPSLFLPEYSLLINNTEYRDKFFLFYFIKNPINKTKDFFKIFTEIWKEFLHDTQGFRGKMQVLKDLIFFICMSEKIKAFNADLVVVHFANSRANPVLFNNILFKTPYIIKMHAVDVFNRPNLFHLKVKRAHKILTISKYNISYIKNRDKDIDISKFIVHHCGILTSRFEFKSVLEKNNKIPIIISVARLTPMKGLDTLIKASSLLHKKGLKHKIILVGHGTYKKFLINLSNNLGIQNSIEFKDYCTPEEIRNYLYVSNLFVLASKIEGIPVAVMEAMSTGLPVITTNISGIPELIENNKDGFLINPGEPVALSNKIEKVLEMPRNELQKISSNARKKIEMYFDQTKLTYELKDIFESLDQNSNLLRGKNSLAVS